jgi:hypothetical protein
MANSKNSEPGNPTAQGKPPQRTPSRCGACRSAYRNPPHMELGRKVQDLTPEQEGDVSGLSVAKRLSIAPEGFQRVPQHLTRIRWRRLGITPLKREEGVSWHLYTWRCWQI